MGCLLYKEAKLEEGKLWECFYNAISNNLEIKCIPEDSKRYISLGWKKTQGKLLWPAQNYVTLFWRQTIYLIKYIFLVLKIPEKAFMFTNS